MWGFVQNIFRSMSFFFDKLIYGFVGTIYNLLTEIAETSIFTDEIIDLFAQRIYALLGIFMLFKVSFSILTYIVNPDDFTDKNKGFGKMISNILITLTLLVLTPWLFSQAMEVQRIILRDNVIGKIFVNIGDSANVSGVSDPGQLMAYETYKAFYHIDTNEYPYCELDNGKLPDTCNVFESDAEKYKNILEYSAQTKNIDIYMDGDLLNLKAKGSDNYFMAYIPFISTACGVVLLLLLIVFCFDIAVRSIKLGFLRMLAPVPIVSRLDPKKGKEVFDKWVKSVLNTYLDLFIRLIAIYFAIFVITNVTQNLYIVDAVTGAQKDPNPFVIVFIILGALLFAKQLPKLIEELTGAKLSGQFSLNPLKKLSEVPIAGAGAALAVGGVDSMIHGNGFAAGVRRNWGNIPLGGGDGKKSILDTADRKMRAEIRKKRDTAQAHYEGRRGYQKIHDDWTHGDKIAKNMRDKGLVSIDPATGKITERDGLFNGENISEYQTMYKSADFIKNKMAFDKADAVSKEFAKGLETVKAGGTWKDTRTGVTYDATSFAELYDKADKAAKTLKGAESVMETMRKMHEEDAKVEADYKFRKYNNIDPTNPKS